jgi:hypothetical protein
MLSDLKRCGKGGKKMSMKIHIAHENIDTVVNLAPVRTIQKKFYTTTSGEKPINIRSIIFDEEITSEKLQENKNLSKLLKEEDPEINFELAGKRIRQARRIIVDKEYNAVYTFQEFDVLERPTGETIERPYTVTYPNINETLPVRISDKYFSKEELLTRLVFSRSYYISHVDGVSYLFLYEIAKKLFELNRLVRVVAYDQQTKKPSPLVLSVGGKKFPAAFLEGKIDGDKYFLILHLSDRELKLPETPEKKTDDDLFEETKKDMDNFIKEGKKV